MAEARPKPHLIIMLASQLRADVVGAIGTTQSFTPKLDLLARHSAVFLRHFTTCPLGGPARASIYTGLHPHQHGALISGISRAPSPHAVIHHDTPLLHRLLLDAGYRVVHVGPRNLPLPGDLGSLLPGIEVVGAASAAEYLKTLTDRGLMVGELESLRDPVLDYVDGKPIVLGGVSPRTSIFPLKEDLYYDRVIAADAAGVLRGHRADEPLALLCHFQLPHPPLWAPQTYAEVVEPAQVKMPTTTGKWYAGTCAMQLANFPGQMGGRMPPEAWREAWAMYHGMVNLLDSCVGQVLSAADHAGLLDDAAVIFTADHGEMLGCHRLWGKMCMYDSAVRVPLIIKPPGPVASLPHRHYWELTDHTDLMPTLLDLAGVERASGSPGVSMRDAIEGRTDPPPGHEYAFASFDGNAGMACRQRMIRSRTHKLIHNVGFAPELYDLVEDPRETRSLAQIPEHRTLCRALADLLNRWMDQHNDPAPRCEA